MTTLPGTGHFVKVGQHRHHTVWECEDCCSSNYIIEKSITRLPNCGIYISTTIRCRNCGNKDTGDEY